MKKKFGQKIIIIISLVLLSTQIIYPLNTDAAAKLNWDNPNSGKSPYKFKLSDYLNSQMVMQVVGCTGIVNKISSTIASLMSLDFKNVKWIWEGKKNRILEMTCLAVDLGLINGLGALPNLSVNQGPKTLGEYCQTKKTVDREVTKALKDQIKVEKGNKFREECLNGIAYTLAKNQLTAMTKATMNWITSGFSGDPFYVRNVNNFMRSIENEVLNKEIGMFQDLSGNYNTRDYPYAIDFARSAINAEQAAQNFTESTKQDLTNYLDGATIDDFSRDFSKGGWNAWLALTQHPQNNPLGDSMIRSQHLAEQQAKEVTNVKEETAQNNGILSDKKCKITLFAKKKSEIETEQARIDEAVIDANKELKYIQDQKEAGTYTGGYNDEEYASSQVAQAEADQKRLSDKIQKLAKGKECAEWEVVTPGSVIKDKLSAALGTPERQLEYADTINKVLNNLFANLINKLRLDGLSSLNSETFNNNSGGFGSNSWTTPTNLTTDVNGNQFTGAGFNENRPFDLTKDLGNLYNHSETIKMGTWNAKDNITIAKNSGGEGYLVPKRGKENTYYEVTVQGNTKLFDNDSAGWAIGDRAFFDGIDWQNWKKEETSPITKRGIIQIQEDYIVIAKDLLKTMPAVMPALGELDYCIPGPNPNWQTNSANTYEAFSEYISGLKTVYKQSGDEGDPKKGKDRVNITNPSEDPNGTIFKNYRNIFNSNQRWLNVVNTSIYSYINVLSNSAHNKKNKKAEWIGDEQISDANDEVSELTQNIFDSLGVFNLEYPKTMEKTYGIIQKQYLEYEETSSIHPFLKEKNPKWIPMVNEGLTMTKKMLFYDDEITTANRDLIDTINEAKSNIDKLKLIKNEVGKIIKTAQDRRDKAITKALNDEMGENFTNNTDYKLKYQECLDEENVNYLDSSEIITTEKDRCFDKLDNDFDGLIDAEDPDCQDLINPDRYTNSSSYTNRRNNAHSY